MENRIKKEMCAIVEQYGTYILTGEGKAYRYLPYWFKELENGDYEMLDWDSLPDDLIDELERQRLANTNEGSTDDKV